MHGRAFCSQLCSKREQNPLGKSPIQLLSPCAHTLGAAALGIRLPPRAASDHPGAFWGPTPPWGSHRGPGGGQMSAFWGEEWQRCHRIPGFWCPLCPSAATQPGVDPAPPLHGLAALSCSLPVPSGVPCRVPAMSPLLLTCSPLCRSPLPPGPGASRRMHPAGSA